jgi:hypothetical protein
MDIKASIAFASACIAVVGAVLTSLLSARQAKRHAELADSFERQRAERQRLEERQDLMRRFRDPLLWAAFDLQSRIFNMVAQGFLQVYLANGTRDEKKYARNNTMFVLAEYLGWVELVRRHVQFLDLGESPKDNRTLVDHLSKVSGTLNTDGLPSPFRVFRGEQRAIGELMIDDNSQEPACIGYAKFCAKLTDDSSFANWFNPLSAGIDDLGQNKTARPDRLILLQNNLLELIDFLDPRSDRFPDRHRSKL